MGKQTFFTLNQASKLIGKSKSTLSNDIKSGKLSVFERIGNSFKIDASELYRVYPPEQIEEQQKTSNELLVELAELRTNVEGLKTLINDKDSTIRDLRERLDSESAERRKLTALLIATDNNQPARVEKKKGWLSAFWGRIRGV